MLTLKHKWNSISSYMGGLRNQLKNQKGFTLIEIVLVLAIAGMIFVVVFLAVEGANKGRRDTEAKSAASRLLAAAEQYASNTSGNYPATASGCTALASYWSAGGFTCNNSVAVDGNNPKNLNYGVSSGKVTVTYYSATSGLAQTISN